MQVPPPLTRRTCPQACQLHTRHAWEAKHRSGVDEQSEEVFHDALRALARDFGDASSIVTFEYLRTYAGKHEEQWTRVVEDPAMGYAHRTDEAMLIGTNYTAELHAAVSALAGTATDLQGFVGAEGAFDEETVVEWGLMNDAETERQRLVRLREGPYKAEEKRRRFPAQLPTQAWHAEKLRAAVKKNHAAALQKGDIESGACETWANAHKRRRVDAGGGGAPETEQAAERRATCLRVCVENEATVRELTTRIQTDVELTLGADMDVAKGRLVATSNLLRPVMAAVAAVAATGVVLWGELSDLLDKGLRAVQLNVPGEDWPDLEEALQQLQATRMEMRGDAPEGVNTLGQLTMAASRPRSRNQQVETDRVRSLRGALDRSDSSVKACQEGVRRMTLYMDKDPKAVLVSSFAASGCSVAAQMAVLATWHNSQSVTVRAGDATRYELDEHGKNPVRASRAAAAAAAD